MCRSILAAIIFLIMLADSAGARSLRERIVVGPPNPANVLGGFTPVEAFIFGLPICMAVKPMVSSALKRRELTLKEATEAIAGCALPFIGSWIVNKYFPERWNHLPMRRWDRDLGVGAYS